VGVPSFIVREKDGSFAYWPLPAPGVTIEHDTTGVAYVRFPENG
jgi:hypothetical protein